MNFQRSYFGCLKTEEGPTLLSWIFPSHCYCAFFYHFEFLSVSMSLSPFLLSLSFSLTKSLLFLYIDSVMHMTESNITLTAGGPYSNPWNSQNLQFHRKYYKTPSPFLYLVLIRCLEHGVRIFFLLSSVNWLMHMVAIAHLPFSLILSNLFLKLPEFILISFVGTSCFAWGKKYNFKE